jgi:HSP20 family molecular chaperone IbpA
VETRLVRNTLDPQGRLRVDIDVQPRREDFVPTNTQILTFDLQGYQPKHVNIRVNEHGMLKITARHHDTSFEHHIDREYYRQHQLLKHVRPDQIRAKMDENQILTIELPQSLAKDKHGWVPYHEPTHPYAKTCFCTLM